MTNFPHDLAILPSKRAYPTPRSSVVQGAWSDGCSLDLDSIAQDVETYGIAGRTWEAAYAMLDYLVSTPTSGPIEFSPPSPLHLLDPDPLRPRLNLLELGAGTGFLSISLARELESKRTGRITMTDLAEVVPLLEGNLEQFLASPGANRKEGNAIELSVKALEWGNSEQVMDLVNSASTPSRYDHILASDLIYFPSLYPPLLRTLLSLTSVTSERPVPPLVVFSYKVRSLIREIPFWEAFGKYFVFYPVLQRPRQPPSAPLDVSDSDPTSLSTSDWRTSPSSDEQIFIFLCTRRSATRDPERLGDEELMRAGDDQFEMILFGELES